MEAEVDQDYEFKERAAIREFDGGISRRDADFSARMENEVREVQENIHKRRDSSRAPSQQQPAVANGKETKKTEIEALRDKRDAMGMKLRAETDPQLKDKLFGEWMDLNTQIYELRKESENGNGRRLSG